MTVQPNIEQFNKDQGSMRRDTMIAGVDEVREARDEV